MSNNVELANRVIEAADAFNKAVRESADAGLLIEARLVDGDPDLTIGATPFPKLIVQVNSKGEDLTRTRS